MTLGFTVIFQCIVMLHDSDEYRFVAVEEFGIVSSYSPRTLRGDIQTMVFVSIYHRIHVLHPVVVVVVVVVCLLLVSSDACRGQAHKLYDL